MRNNISGRNCEAADSGSRCDNNTEWCLLAPLCITTPANCQKLPCLKTISGHGAPDREVVIRIDCDFEFEACTSCGGSFRVCSPDPLCPGYHTIEVCYKNEPGCPCACVWVFIREPVILSAPVITFPETGAVVTDDRPIITGSAMPGSLVSVTTQNCQCLSVFAEAEGFWSVQFEFPFAQGEQIITAVQQQSECSASEMAYSAFTVQSVAAAIFASDNAL